MKRKLIALVLSTAMAASLTACAGGTSGNTTGSSAASSEPAATSSKAEADTSAPSATGEDENTLTVWCWDKSFNIYAMEEAGKIYQKDHPDFKLNVVEIKSDDIETKITTAVSAGDMSILPDIFLMQDNSYQKYVANFPEAFTVLNDSGVNFDDFADAKVAYSTVDGNHYGVPFDNGTTITALRTDILEQAGLTLDDFKDITWSKFIELGKQVKEKTNTPLLTFEAGLSDLGTMMLQSCGSSMFKEDGSVNLVGNDVLKAALENYKEMVDAGVLVEVTDWDQYIASMNNGTTAGVINGCWIIASIKGAEDQSGKWGIVNFPKMDGFAEATNYSNNGGSSWAVSSNCKNKELAFDLLKSTFAGSTELYDTILPASGALATYLPAGESAVYAEPQEFFGGQPIFKDITDFASKVPSNITGAYYYDARDAIGDAVTNMIQNNSNIDDEIANAQSTVEFNMGG